MSTEYKHHISLFSCNTFLTFMFACDNDDNDENRFAVDGVGPVVFPYPCMYPEQYDYMTALKHAVLDSSKVCAAAGLFLFSLHLLTTLWTLTGRFSPQLPHIHTPTHRGKRTRV